MSLELAELMYRQQRLMRAMDWPGGRPAIDTSSVGNEEAAKGHLLAAIVECTEALDELNWKPWKPKCKVIDREALATELMDIVQFVCNAALVMELDAVDLEQALRKKWEENNRRVEAKEVTHV